MTKTWRELEAEGVHRCCVVYRGGKRCRRRALANGIKAGFWCQKHAPIMASVAAWNKEAIESTLKPIKPATED